MSVLTTSGDLVGRLRRWMPPVGVRLEREDYDMIIQAADAIERMESALCHISGLALANVPPSPERKRPYGNL